MTDTPNSLVPLPFSLLQQIQRLQRDAARALKGCNYPGTRTLNERKAAEILRSCLVEELGIRLTYYETLRAFEWGWNSEIATQAVASILGCFPQNEFIKQDENGQPTYEEDRQFLDELIRTGWDYIVQRRIGGAQSSSGQPSQNPEDWSPLHRYIEAGKSIKTLMEGPHEEIRELVVRQSIAERESIKPEEVTWRQIQSEVAGLLPYYPAIRLIPIVAKETTTGRSKSAPRVDSMEIRRREKLLEDYKAATGAPSNMRIYKAAHSGIHKPQFYDWLNGILPSSSETAKNFERFLSAKKLPVPRKTKG
jgi:hypothetical protein